MIIYENIIIDKGNYVEECGSEMFITFGDNAPAELKDYCYIWKKKSINDEIKENDVLFINEEEFKILKVGSIASKNLNDLGHLTFNFSGDEDNLLPGTIIIEKKNCPKLDINTIIKIERR